jgi:thiamine-monophosphate kinase
MESEFIAWLRRRLPPHPLLKLGPGDDAAVLRLAGSPECVVTVDLLTDGVDFNLGEVNPRRVGRKALAVNLSDLAAMAAQPVAALVALALPRQGGKQLAIELYEGLLPLAERYAVAIAGGDTNSWDGPLVISITAIGRSSARGVLTRGGARHGDAILVTGNFGGSILGRHLDFEPRVNEALILHERYTVHAAMDVSDGLSLDLSRISAESGCGAVIHESAIPISDDAVRLSKQAADGTPLQHALSDGEDFELILAVEPAEADQMFEQQSIGVPLTRIGNFTAEPGLFIVGSDGTKQVLHPRGYEHKLS